MKNWRTLDPDRIRLLTTHFTPYRAGHKIKCVVIHHNAGILDIDQIWQVWQTREASAHYQVCVDGTIGQLVYDEDTAWHAANLTRNQESIGVEHSNSTGGPGWEISEKTREEGAHLVAAICVKYGLGRPAWGVNVFPHSDTGQTSCPLHLGPRGKYGASYISRAQYWYDQMTHPSAPAPATPEPPKTHPITPDRVGVLTLDQLAGPGKTDTGAPDWSGWPQLDGCTVVDFLAKMKEDIINEIREGRAA